jgi:hypothetical protein
MTQAQLAERAHVSQSVISAYESGARQPSLPTLARLIAASGFELDLRVRRSSSGLRKLRGPLGMRVRRHRQQIRRIASEHGLSNVRVFGSVARGEETTDSDIDLLVDIAPEVGLLGLARCRSELASLLGGRVELVPAADLKAHVADSAMADAVLL